jgi:hypothetical protein
MLELASNVSLQFDVFLSAGARSAQMYQPVLVERMTFGIGNILYEFGKAVADAQPCALPLCLRV